MHCSDGYLRIIGHECGHHFFDEDSYADALSQYEAETEEGTARNLLADRMPDLARTLLEAMTVARGLNDLLSFREHLIASITQRAASALRRARTGDQLWVEVPSNATDDRGRALLERKVIATVGGLDALVPRSKLLGDLVQSIHDGDRVLIIERDEMTERLAAMSRHEAFAAAKALRRLDQSLNAAKAERQNLCALLSEDGLKGLSVWGRHSQCPTPFWIEIAPGRRAYASKGLRPRFWERGGHMVMPPLTSYEPVEVR